MVSEPPGAEARRKTSLHTLKNGSGTGEVNPTPTDLLECWTRYESEDDTEASVDSEAPIISATCASSESELREAPDGDGDVEVELEALPRPDTPSSTVVSGLDLGLRFLSPSQTTQSISRTLQR